MEVRFGAKVVDRDGQGLLHLRDQREVIAPAQPGGAHRRSHCAQGE